MASQMLKLKGGVPVTFINNVFFLLSSFLFFFSASNTINKITLV